MPSSNVKTVRDAEIKTFQRADSFYHCAPIAQIIANAVKVCNNTYLIQERDGERVTSYALAFQGTKIVRYHADGSYTLNMGGYATSTTRHRINQFSPFRVHQRGLLQYVSGIASYKVVTRGDYPAGDTLTLTPSSK